MEEKKKERKSGKQLDVSVNRKKKKKEKTYKQQATQDTKLDVPDDRQKGHTSL